MNSELTREWRKWHNIIVYETGRPPWHAVFNGSPNGLTTQISIHPEHTETRLQEGQYESFVPVLMDRCHQQRVRHALEPEWEARFEPRSYGFRPGRGCHDAIAAIYNVCKGPMARRVWALDADLAAAFDSIDHSSSSGAARVVPGQGPDPGLAEGGRVRGRQGVRAD